MPQPVHSRIGLGHEGRDQAMLLGGRLDQALQHDRFVASLEHIGAVPEHDLHLARRIFRDERLGGQALDLGKGIEIVKEGCEIIEILQMVGLVVLRAPARW